MTGIEVPDLELSCWIIEAARSEVLAQRGHTDSARRAAERARILAGVCAARGIKILPRIAGQHSHWMAQVAGSDEETGAAGRVFLQRIGLYVNAYMRGRMPQTEQERLAELSAQDLDEVNTALSVQGLPGIPDDDWPPPKKFEESGSNLRFAIVSDPHIQPLENPYVEQAVESLRRAGATFTILPGDVTLDGDEKSFVQAHSLFSRISAPVLPTLGNHDMAASAEGREKDAQREQGEPVQSQSTSVRSDPIAEGPRRFEAVFGQKPYGVHEFDGVRIILLNSAVPAVSPFPPFDILGGDFTDAPAGSVPWGDFSEEISDWMSCLGPSEGLTFISLHHPPYPYPGFPPLVFGLGKSSTEKLASLVERTGAQAIFCGHTHRSALRTFEGIPLIEVPAIGHWPFAFGMVEVAAPGRPQGGWWSFNLHPLPDRPGRARDHANYIFHRYAAGDKTGHTFFQQL